MTYKNCTEAWKAGRSDIPKTDPAYALHLDGTHSARTPNEPDGIACEGKHAPSWFVPIKTFEKPKTNTNVAPKAQAIKQDELALTGPGSNYLTLGILVVLIGAALLVLGRKWVR